MKTGDAPTPRAYRGVRPGGRSERVRLAVVSATLEELARDGYADLSLARVAARAGVALSTVHRRWSSKAGLAAEATSHLLDSLPELEDHGSAHAELHDLASRAVRTLRTPTVTAVLRALMLLPPGDLEALRAAHDGIAARVLAPVVERGVARGDLPPATDPGRLAERLLAGIWFRSFVTGLPLDDRSVDAFVADALAATRAAGR